MWTWISGTNIPNDTGYYGVQCTPSTNNLPPARSENRVCWKDDCHRFWFMGGTTLNWAATVNNDLWCYDPATDLWTWISGAAIPNQLGSYGTQTVSSPTNEPPARMGAVGWQTGSALWLFGGRAQGNLYNDLWKYIIDPNCPGCVITGTDENNHEHFSIYPNPTNGMLTITSSSDITEIEIYNFWGQKIIEQTMTGKQETIDFSTHPKGVYFLRLIQDNG